MTKDTHFPPVTPAQVEQFVRLFRGRNDVHGTYDFATKRSWQVKRPVTLEIVYQHLEGIRPLGIYPLVEETVWFAATDFDVPDTQAVARFVAVVGARGWVPLVERTKSKGYHCWFFFDKSGVPAAAVRRVLREALADAGQPNVEVFPKQDRLGSGEFGNFINLPLFGRLVPEGRAVFVDQAFNMCTDQWRQLEQAVVSIVPGSPASGEKPSAPVANVPPGAGKQPAAFSAQTWGLPPCAQRMLDQGVTELQRLACFRLAVALRLAGLPFAATHDILQLWVRRIRPSDGRRVLLPTEVAAQVRGAYGSRKYLGYGCHDPAVQPYCSPDCRLYRRNHHAA